MPRQVHSFFLPDLVAIRECTCFNLKKNNNLSCNSILNKFSFAWKKILKEKVDWTLSLPG